MGMRLLVYIVALVVIFFRFIAAGFPVPPRSLLELLARLGQGKEIGVRGTIQDQLFTGNACR
jgi:hypothetical protein